MILLESIKNRIATIEAKTGVTLSPEIINNLIGELSNEDPVTWGMVHRNLKGTPYRFELPPEMRVNRKIWNQHRPFLKQMLADQAPSKCFEKSRQCGASELSVTEVLWFLDAHPFSKAVYVFPTEQQMNDFSNTRIAPVFQESPYLQKMLGRPDSVHNKKVGKESFLIMRSGQTSRAGEGVDADVLFIDEKDRMVDKIESAFEQSLSSSAYGWVREFSTPTLPGTGVDKVFQSSCQYYWYVKCDSGHRQTLIYPDNIQQLSDIDPTEEVVPEGTFDLKCSTAGCISKINRWEGEWVPHVPGHRQKTHAGYQINQLACVWLSIDRIMQQWRKYRFKDAFYNYVLGIPYSSNDGLITEDALMNCMDQTRFFPGVRRQEYTAVVAGIDWGTYNWCVVLGRRPDGRWEVCGLKYVTDDADVLIAAKALADFIRPYNPQYVVADLGYGRDRCMELQRQFPDRVYACTYSSGNATDKTVNPTWSDTSMRVSVNRTAHLRWMLESIKRRMVVFPGEREAYNLFFKHILNLALIHEEEEDPKTHEIEIVERIGHKGDDHYAHAMAYAILASQKLTDGGGLYWEFFPTT